MYFLYNFNQKIIKKSSRLYTISIMDMNKPKKVREIIDSPETLLEFMVRPVHSLSCDNTKHVVR